MIIAEIGNRAGLLSTSQVTGVEAARSRRLAIYVLYGGALLVGATSALFPASSVHLRDIRGFSDSAYGSIFLPQLVTAIAGAVCGAFVSRSWDLSRLFRAAVACVLLAQVLVALAGWRGYHVSTTVALFTTMGGTAAWGLGFGLGGGPVNGLVARYFPRTTGTAITAWYTCGGVGLTLSPLLVAACERAGHWMWSPVLLMVLTIVVVWKSYSLRPPAPTHAESAAAVPGSAAAGRASREIAFWCLAVAAVCYGLGESTFANWAVLYAQDDLKLAPTAAATALAAFWGCLTFGRFVSSWVALEVTPLAFLRTLPLLTIGAFLTVRSVHSPLTVVAAFGFAGAACSAYFPMLIAHAAQRYGGEVPWVAAMLSASTMTGEGIGSYIIGAFRASVGIRDLYLYALAYPILALGCVMVATRPRWRRSAE